MCSHAFTASRHHPLTRMNMHVMRMHYAITRMHTQVMRMHTHVLTRSRVCIHAHVFPSLMCHAHAMHDITLYVSHACHAWHHATTPAHAYAYACDAYAAPPSHAYAASPSHAYAHACDGYKYACDAYACACVRTRSRHHANHPLTRIHAYASCVHTRSRHHAHHPLTRMHTHVMRMHTHVLTRSRVCIHTHLMPSRM